MGGGTFAPMYDAEIQLVVAEMFPSRREASKRIGYIRTRVPGRQTGIFPVTPRYHHYLFALLTTPGRRLSPLDVVPTVP